MRSKAAIVGAVTVGIAIVATACRSSRPPVSFVVSTYTTNRVDGWEKTHGGRPFVVALVAVTNLSNRPFTYSEVINDAPGVTTLGGSGVPSVQKLPTRERTLQPRQGFIFEAIPDLYDSGLVFHYRDVRLIHRIRDQLPDWMGDWLPIPTSECSVRATTE